MCLPSESIQTLLSTENLGVEHKALLLSTEKKILCRFEWGRAVSNIWVVFLEPFPTNSSHLASCFTDLSKELVFHRTGAEYLLFKSCLWVFPNKGNRSRLRVEADCCFGVEQWPTHQFKSWAVVVVIRMMCVPLFVVSQPVSCVFDGNRLQWNSFVGLKSSYFGSAMLGLYKCFSANICQSVEVFLELMYQSQKLQHSVKFL